MGGCSVIKNRFGQYRPWTQSGPLGLYDCQSVLDNGGIKILNPGDENF